jgi:hypothetical protein
LLQARIGNTAITIWNWTASILASGEDRIAGKISNILNINNSSGGNACKEQDGSDGELHFEKD